MTIPVRDAATVILLRDGASGVEAWLLRRVPEMDFAAGMTVFPGGRVDEADALLPWAGRPASWFADRFGCEEPEARALVGAAVREVFEETGVMLTAPPTTAAADARDAVEAGTLPFADLLLSLQVAVDADALRPWARWVTPESETTRRYDTRFFVAAMPVGVEAADVTSESTIAEWVPAAEAAQQHDQGERPMLPPTLINLRLVAEFGSVADVLAAADRQPLAAVQPVLHRDADGRIRVELPDGTEMGLL